MTRLSDDVKEMQAFDRIRKNEHNPVSNILSSFKTECVKYSFYRGLNPQSMTSESFCPTRAI